jgi:pimeloyl-ACP methyl ester carboxylesterase
VCSESPDVVDRTAGDHNRPVAFIALVHGGAHGGWCWERLVPELEALGHQCSAPDLPIEDPHGASEWADAVIATIPAGAQRTLVVGHSLAGLCLPVVASRIRVDRLVFLAAMVPVPGRSYLEVLHDEPDAIKTLDIGATLAEAQASDGFDGVMPYARAVEMFYGDLDEETAQAAWRRLRPQGVTAFTEPCPIEAWPSVSSTYILMTEDGSVEPEWSRRVARGRLGADVIELAGGHSPFYSRPRELAEVLDRLART